jgi:vancomycin permeability regulator SanA
MKHSRQEVAISYQNHIFCLPRQWYNSIMSLKRLVKMFIYAFLILIFLGGAFLVLPRLFTSLYAKQRMFDVSDAPKGRVAIVFGAGLWRDGSPTPVLRDRVATAAELYFTGKAEKLLMSGDNQFDHYNEPSAMRAYAISLGVPEEAIILDFAGRRTYDTCYRARDIFGVQEALLVTQRFHLPRAIYICNQLGVSGEGVLANQRIYRRRSLTYWNLRELAATLVAMWEVNITRPKPVLGNPEPIFPLEAQ